MNKLVFCAISMVFAAGLQVQLITERTLDSQSRRYKIPNDQEELKEDYKASLLEFARNCFESFKINVVLSSNGSSTSDRILSVLMSATVQSFWTINDIPSTHHSAVKNDTGHYKFVTLLVGNVNEFVERFAMLRLAFAYNPRARHLILIVKKPDDDEVEMIFKECWSHKVLNVALIISNQEEAYTYNPFLKNDSIVLEKVTDWTRLFYDKLRNMNGHSISIRYIPFAGNERTRWIKAEKTYKFFGSDIGHARAFVQSVNATPSFTNITDDIVPRYVNFTYRVKIWNEGKFHGVEIWANFMPFDLKIQDRSERGYPLRRDSLRVFVPKSGLKRPNIFNPYGNIAWVCIGLSFITYALYSCILYKWRKIDDNAFLRTLGIFLGKNLSKRRYGLLEKFTFLIFTMSSLLILSAYQGALYGALTTDTYYPEINTMPELRKRIKVIYVFNVLLELLRKSVEPGIMVREFGTDGDFTDFMTAHRLEAYAFPQTVGQNVVKFKVLSENSIPFYHMMSEYSVPGFVSHAVPYGSPYFDKLNQVYLACREAGLTQYWESEVKTWDILRGKSISDIPEGRTLKKLSLQTQLNGFYIWGVGLLLSAFCFIAEIYSKFISKQVIQT